MKVGVLKYNCVKCGEEVVLEYRPYMSPVTEEKFKSLFDKKLCVFCDADS